MNHDTAMIKVLITSQSVHIYGYYNMRLAILNYWQDLPTRYTKLGRISVKMIYEINIHKSYFIYFKFGYNQIHVEPFA